MAITGISDVAYFLPKYYDKVFLEMLNPVPKAAQYTIRKPIPLHTGNYAYFPKMTVTWNAPIGYNISTDGSVITPEAIVDEQVAVKCLQWGNAKAISDLVEATSIDSTTEETVKDLANQANNMLDKIIFSRAYATPGATVNMHYASSSTTSVYASSIGASFGGFAMQYVDTTILASTPSAAYASCGNTGNVMTATALRKAIKTLKAANVRPLEEAEGCFAFLCHTNTAMKLLADTSIQDLYRYTDPENLKKGIVGRYAGALIVEDNNVLTSAGGSSSANLYFSLLLGKGAMGTTEIDGKIKTYVKPAGSAGTADPINQYATFGWKANFEAVILNASCGLIICSNDD